MSIHTAGPIGKLEHLECRESCEKQRGTSVGLFDAIFEVRGGAGGVDVGFGDGVGTFEIRSSM